MSFSNRVDQGYLSFAKGLVTEFNPLAPPEGTTSDELNMDIDTNGMTRVRRKPVNEISRQTQSGFRGSVVFSSYWEHLDRVLAIFKYDTPLVAGETTLSILVFNPNVTDSIEITVPVQVADEVYVTPSVSYARGRAVIILGGLPLVLEKSATSYNLYNVNILVRDFKLLNDGLRISQRPAALTDLHQYNLYNAGWYQHRKVQDTGKPVSDPVLFFNTKRSQYPSNADISYLGDVTDTDGELVFEPSSYDNIDTGSTEAPRGHYIYSIRDIDRESRRLNKDRDGSDASSLVAIIEDGDDPVTGDPPVPDNPWIPPEQGWCDPVTGLCWNIP